MNSSDSVISVYSDARAEYTKQLCVFLIPAYFQFFIDLLEKSKQTMINDSKKVLWQFQTYLNDIHDWNMDKVNNEIHIIYNNSGCDYLDDLLTAVFIAHTKVLTAIRISSNGKKVEINIPKVEHFLFKALCECAKLLWSSIYLFRDGISSVEKQQNYRAIELLLNEGVLQAVRSLIPVKSILKDFINGDINSNKKAVTEDDSDDDTDTGTAAAVPNAKSDILINDKNPDDKTNVLINDKNPDDKTNVLTDVLTNEKTDDKPDDKTTDNDDAPTIVLDDKPAVSFGQFNSMFSSDDPMSSDMINASDDEEEDAPPVLEILEDNGVPIVGAIDFEELNSASDDIPLAAGDYETL